MAIQASEFKWHYLINVPLCQKQNDWKVDFTASADNSPPDRSSKHLMNWTVLEHTSIWKMWRGQWRIFLSGSRLRKWVNQDSCKKSATSCFAMHKWQQGDPTQSAHQSKSIPWMLSSKYLLWPWKTRHTQPEKSYSKMQAFSLRTTKQRTKTCLS